jgi:hypothetical protein
MEVDLPMTLVTNSRFRRAVVEAICIPISYRSESGDIESSEGSMKRIAVLAAMLAASALSASAQWATVYYAGWAK